MTPRNPRKQHAAQSNTAANPATVRSASDPGDETARNFRYQHSYGVILMIAAQRGDRPYVAIWCEHHEDFLAQRRDGRFNGYQIKTSKPELGAWTLSDADLVKSIGRFVDLVTAFGEHIAELHFVSNTAFDVVTPSSKDEKRRARCPQLFLAHLRACPAPDAVSAPFIGVFLELQAACGCSAETLFDVLRRMNVIQGPSRGEVDAALSHEHIARLPECGGLTAAQLDAFRDELVAIVHRASSLHVTDPIRHLRPLLDGKDRDPALEAKRLIIADIAVYRATTVPFQFPGAPTLALGVPRQPVVLVQKLSRGGLREELEYLRERERAAEYNLIEDATRRPDVYPKLLRQIEQMVFGECCEAHLRARQRPEPYGAAMLIDVQDRLRHLAEDHAAMVGNQRYECLVGVAGLLTTDCRVWWSPRFEIEAGPSPADE